jgi:cytoskeletal protein CcmA (bactofilin family)
MMCGTAMEKLTSFLGVQSKFQGELMLKGTLRIDGFATGKLQADQVILSETATIKGEVIAKRIIVGGKVEGSLRAQEIIEITSKGKVKGEIFTCRLSIKEGGVFDGQIDMKADDPDPRAY